MTRANDLLRFLRAQGLRANPSERAQTIRLRVLREPLKNSKGTSVTISALGGAGTLTMTVGEARNISLNSGELDLSTRERQDCRVWAHIDNLRTNPGSLSRGVGGALLDRAIEEARSLGAEGVSLQARAKGGANGELSQAQLMAFYERHGFGMYDPENPSEFLWHMVLDLRSPGSTPRPAPGLPRDRLRLGKPAPRQQQIRDRLALIKMQDEETDTGTR